MKDKHDLDLVAKKGDVSLLAAQLRAFPDQGQLSHWYNTAGFQPDIPTEDNAREIIRYVQCFDSWIDYEAFTAELQNSHSIVAAFEQAADAIAEGDLPIVKSLLSGHPDLISMRSRRNHHATLLNYIGANGFESWRQKTPSNAVEVAQLLLNAGAEVDAWGDMYGGTSTLGLVATSVHPVLAGVQEPLMNILIQHGANPNHAVAPDYTGGMLILACIHNGRYEPIQYLARQGAKVDFECACALGQLEMVKALWDKTPVEKRNIGLTWACQFGHREVAEYLLDHDVPLNIYVNGTTPLLAAAFGSQLEIVQWLLDLGADMEAVNDYGGTALGQTIWCLYNHRLPTHPYIMELLIRRGAVINNDWQPYINELRNR